jgi:hypothetical protein
MDIQYLLVLQHFREATGGIFNSFFIFFSDMGWSIFPMLIVSGVYWSIDKKAGRYLLTTMRISDYIANFIKLTACVYRPWIRDPAVKPIESVFASSTGYSFPSGHTTRDIALGRDLLTTMRISDRPWIRDPAVKPIESVFDRRPATLFRADILGTSLWDRGLVPEKPGAP